VIYKQNRGLELSFSFLLSQFI